MSAALLQDANKQHTIADDLESALHVLTWTTLRYVPHKMTSASLNEHLREVYDQYSILTGTGGRAKGLSLAARQYVPHALELEQPSPLLDLLEALSDPFVAVYDPNPGKTSKYIRKKQGSNLEISSDYNDRMVCSRSPQWFLDTIQDALNDTWPPDDGSLLLPGQVQRGKRPRSPSVAASNEVKFAKHHY